jgi:hypothetical protein
MTGMEFDQRLKDDRRQGLSHILIVVWFDCLMLISFPYAAICYLEI